METVKKFFARKTVGFYIGLACAVWSLICSIVYIVGFSPSGELGDYTSYGVFVFTLLAFIGFAVTSLFKQTSAFAAPIEAFCIFVALILFAIDGYLYFPEVFYGGFNFAGFFGMNGAFLFCLLSLLVLPIISSVCIYFKQEKAQETNNGEPISEVNA